MKRFVLGEVCYYIAVQKDIHTICAQYPAWQLQADQLVGEWDVADFATVRRMVTGICDVADELNHHPTVTFTYNTVRVATTTHDAGNTVTELDIELARQVSVLVGE